MTNEDKEISNLILANHKRKEGNKFKLKNHFLTIVLLIIFTILALIIKQVLGVYSFMAYCYLALCFCIYIYKLECRAAVRNNESAWRKESLTKDDFLFLSKCSDEFKDRIKKEMAPDGSLTCISLEQICRSEYESTKNKTKRQEIEALLK
ncbi:hypothetical protein U0D24_21920 [Hafnia paralvei]|uniref:hypothetical protein n=1 Tax=Hafnia paralvei TaxID=546367 RepID=UPI002FDBA194